MLNEKSIQHSELCEIKNAPDCADFRGYFFLEGACQSLVEQSVF